MTRCPALLLAALALLLPGCHDAVDPAANERILLLASELFGGGDRCARVLNDMVASSGVMGDGRFTVVTASNGDGESLLEALRTAPDARAVVVIVGDSSLLTGIDTNARFPEHKQITSRVVDTAALESTLDQLRELAATRGMHCVLATHPLGRQGRLELPELVDVADLVRQHGATLDLAAAFAARESELLFAHGVDVLDNYGHDVLADTIFKALLGEAPLIPAQDLEESAARDEIAALLVWARGDDELFRWAAHRVLREPPVGAVQGVRQATIATLRNGLTPGSRQRWTELEGLPGAGHVPGLALGQMITSGKLPPANSSDPDEQALAKVLSAFTDPEGAGDPLAVADSLVAAGPHRASAWLALEFAARLTKQRRGVSRLALRHLQTLEGVVSPARWEQLSSSWPDCLGALPALTLLEHIYRSHLPTGPTLHAARRASRQGLVSRALSVWDRSTRLLTLPPTWTAERQRIAALASR